MPSAGPFRIPISSLKTNSRAGEKPFPSEPISTTLEIIKSARRTSEILEISYTSWSQ